MVPKLNKKRLEGDLWMKGLLVCEDYVIKICAS